MKVLICGSRNWADRWAICKRLNALRAIHSIDVIHGAAPGADRMAQTYCDANRVPVQQFPADWQTHGKAAGPIRNAHMLDQAPDLVLAFQRNGSRGTQHTIDEARRRGIPVEVYTA